jgi:choline dehydrogenase-like flavoprotein
LILTHHEGGPAGSAIASRLATSAKAPRVLLLEAGGTNSEPSSRPIADRYTTFYTHPHYNWGYQTVPQKHLLGRTIDYSRGKGLGGSSAINFAFYTRGPDSDWDEWAKLVGDDFFNAKNALKRFKRIEGYASVHDPGHIKYVNPSPELHGSDGPVKVSFAKEWEKNMEYQMLAAKEYGLPSNLDLNSGNPIGNGVNPYTGFAAKRTTAATAYLSNPPSNLTIITDAQASKIIFDGKRAIGVQAGGKDYLAANDIIISAGAVDTPKLLLLSGIGPKDELSSHGISSVIDLPGVGKNLQDHLYVRSTVQVADDHHDRAKWAEEKVMQEARSQFEKDGTGPLSILYNSAVVGFFRDEKLYETKEFADLPKEVQAYIKAPTNPTWEQAVCCPTMTPFSDPAKTYLTNVVFGMVPQSRGTVTLASANVSDAPIIDPNFLAHPFDRRNLIEAVKISNGLLTSPPNARVTIADYETPKSMSDEDVLRHIQELGGSTFHPAGTAKMGRKDDEMAVIDTNFKVRGMEGLRVADLSVTPRLPNCHTVSTGYLIGETAAERLIEEYGLNK